MSHARMVREYQGLPELTLAAIVAILEGRVHEHANELSAAQGSLAAARKAQKNQKRAAKKCDRLKSPE